MQVTETVAEGLEREYKVVIPAADFRAKFDTQLNQLGDRVQLAGFRPGKVPLAVLRQRYGKSVMGEVLERAVSETTEKLVSERGLRPVGQPRIEITSFADDADVEYKVAIEVMPDLKPMDFSTIKLARPVVDVPAAEIQQGLEVLAQRRRRFEPIASPRPSANGDVLVIDYDGRIDGEEFPGGSAQGQHLELGSGHFIPGFEEQLVGRGVGQPTEVSVTFPADYPAKNLAGRMAAFEVNIKEIRAAIVPATDDELAKSLGAADLNDLRRKVLKQIGDDYAAVARSKLKRDLLDALDAGHDFPLPPNMVDGEFEAIWKQIELARENGTLDADDIGKTDEQLKKEYRDIAARRVRLGLLLSEVGRLNNIQVANEELQRAALAEAHRHPGRERQFAEAIQNSPAILTQLRAALYEDKVVDFILELAQVGERHVTPDELRGMTAPESQAAAQQQPQ